MIGHSEQLHDLAAALVKTQAAMRVVQANSLGHVEGNGEERSYRYADLASVWAAVRKPLAKHGLSVVQTCEPSSRGELRLTTTLLHESGQWISGTESIPVLAPTAQCYGSALTYARRYGLAAILGVCVDDDDDDGAAASKPAAAERTRKQTVPVGPRAQAPGQAEQPKPSGKAPATPGPASSRTETGPNQSWRQVPYNRASETQLKSFARAFAEARGIETVSSEDIRRDFGVDGKLVDHFGTRLLGVIIESASSGAPQPDGGTRSEAVREPVSAVPDATRAPAGAAETAEPRT